MPRYNMFLTGVIDSSLFGTTKDIPFSISALKFIYPVQYSTGEEIPEHNHH